MRTKNKKINKKSAAVQIKLNMIFLFIHEEVQEKDVEYLSDSSSTSL